MLDHGVSVHIAGNTVTAAGLLELSSVLWHELNHRQCVWLIRGGGGNNTKTVCTTAAPAHPILLVPLPCRVGRRVTGQSALPGTKWIYVVSFFFFSPDLSCLKFAVVSPPLAVFQRWSVRVTQSSYSICFKLMALCYEVPVYTWQQRLPVGRQHL